MADHVQWYLERMIPELEDYEQRGIFNSEEIRSIVSRRKAFEYAMKRTPMRQIDGLRAIEYELSLEKLCKLRKSKLASASKTSAFDFAIQQRINFIFERLVKKFHGDMSLWAQYIAFCRHTSSHKILSRVFSKCLQLHPRAIEMWIEAAAFEYEVNGNVELARVLLQRGLRINATESRLWLEYFRLELMFVKRLRDRRSVLGLNSSSSSTTTTSSEVANDESSDVIALEKESQAKAILVEESSQKSEKEKSRSKVLDGAIPLIVYQQAIASIPDDLQMRLDFCSLAVEFPPSFTSHIVTEILSSVVKSFPSSTVAWTAYATTTTSNCNSMEDFNNVSKRFVQGIDTIEGGSVELTYSYVSWLEDRIRTARSDISSSAIRVLQNLYESISVKTADLYYKQIDFESRQQNDGVLKLCEEACTEFPQSCKLHLQYVELLLLRTPTEVEKARSVLKSVWMAAVDQESVEGLVSVISRWLQLSSSSTSGRNCTNVLNDILRVKDDSSLLPLLVLYLNYEFVLGGKSRARDVYKYVLKSGRVFNQESKAEFLRICISLEQTSDDSCTFVVKLYEMLVTSVNPNGVENWKAYEAYHLHREEWELGHAVQARAIRQLE